MEKRSSIPLKDIKIEDSFWDRYTKLVADVIIPYQWDVLNDRVKEAQPGYCIHNLKIAAGKEDGEFKGVVFQDTDVAKWLEAVAYSLASKPDKELEKTADEVIELLLEAQSEDGYLDTYFMIKEPDLKWTNLVEGHELYTAGHFIEAAVAYYKTTGKDTFLKLVRRTADLICETFSLEKNKDGYPGHQEIELALVKLYEVTKEKKYLELAKNFIDRRGSEPNYFLEEEKKPAFKRIFPEFENYLPLYSQSHLPVRQQKTAEGHAVRAVYMYCAMADLAFEYEDEELLDVCETLWNNMVNRRMYITGSIGSSGILERFTADYDLPNDRNYSETCASIGLALFGRRMAAITGDGKYYDVVERALYNTVLSGIAMDGKSFFYVNPLEVWPANCLPRTSMEHVKPVRQKWFGVACCPPNIARTLASLGEYIYFCRKDCIWVNLFVAGEAKFQIEGYDIRLAVDTKFPFEGEIKIKIDNREHLPFKLAVRIPKYVEQYTIELDHESLINLKPDKGYVFIEINKEQELKINFNLPVRYIRANPRIRQNCGKVALMKGPLVYCIEEMDNGDDLAAISIDTNKTVAESYDEQLLGGTMVLTASGRKLSKADWDPDVPYKEKKPVWEDVAITAVPYSYWGNRKPGEMLVWIKEILND